MKQTTLFQILSDETRLRLLALMGGEGELCVCEFVHSLGLSQPKISRHLAILRAAEIIVPRRFAQWIFHRINPALPHWESQVIEAAVEGLRDETCVKEDRSRLENMTGRPPHRPSNPDGGHD